MASECAGGNEFDGRIGLRVSSIFVVFVGSFFGAVVPVYAARSRRIGVPGWAFFAAKHFGSGVIVATAFIHLLAPASEALHDDCLSGLITEYSWVEGICLMSVFLLFFVELTTSRLAVARHPRPLPHDRSPDDNDDEHACRSRDSPDSKPNGQSSAPAVVQTPSQHPDDERLALLPHQQQPLNEADPADALELESYAAQLAAILILEFGVVFHSILIGLTLAVAGDEFITLYVVLVLHQTFEGLGLGARLGSIAWPSSRRWTPYALACGYAVSTPAAIAAGLAVRSTFTPRSPTALIVSGVFDALAAGILIYTGLVELMARDFLFSRDMQQAPLRVVLAAVGWMALGAALMALLGKWA